MPLIASFLLASLQHLLAVYLVSFVHQLFRINPTQMVKFYTFQKHGKYKKLFFFLCACFLLNNASAQLSGTYTIGGTASDYASISAAIADLKTVGVNGPVIFNVNDGEYLEQVEFLAVTGASATNTITVQPASGVSGSVLIKHAALSDADNFVLRFNNAEHYVIRNLRLKADGTSYARVVHVTNIARNLLFEGNQVESLVFNNSSLNYTGFTITPSTGENIRLLNNSISGGSHGFYYMASSTSKARGTVFRGNRVSDAYYRSVYFGNLHGGLVEDNIISATNTYTQYRGLSFETCDGQLFIRGNKIAGGGGDALYLSKCHATATEPGLIANNFMASSGGVERSFSFSGGSNYRIYYNSVNHSGSGSAFYFWGFSATGIELRNNIFKAATGYAIYTWYC